MNELNGVGLIAEERKRQKSVEGWTPEHDDLHIEGEIAGAAVSYADAAYRQVVYGTGCVDRPSRTWRWSAEWWKPSPDPIRNLVKAGALIAAEIDRLQRIKVLEESR